MTDDTTDDTDPFEPEAIAAVMQHMNENHAADSLIICRGLAGPDDATAARMTGMDPDGIDFAATVGHSEVPVRLPWPQAVTNRAEVRSAIVALYAQAFTRLGLAPDTSEH